MASCPTGRPSGASWRSGSRGGPGRHPAAGGPGYFSRGCTMIFTADSLSWIQGMGKVRERLVVLLDLDRAFSAQALAELARLPADTTEPRRHSHCPATPAPE
ncbi:hypothetical protein Aave_3544 [Paracidovorax citrulli AAC00-1]|uniref:Uncharacterized protein n=2 Tax=Paracidovorax citrulli TaxID=80869 RepID=A1TT08_PARC0|nr:hypothetical protein Aave_3544 [Paracidovorax citrulli AAC00-1]